MQSVPRLTSVCISLETDTFYTFFMNIFYSVNFNIFFYFLACAVHPEKQAGPKQHLKDVKQK